LPTVELQLPALQPVAGNYRLVEQVAAKVSQANSRKQSIERRMYMYILIPDGGCHWRTARFFSNVSHFSSVH
jgi:hypothetical protein